MKSHIPYSIAALAAAGVISVATAQTGQADTSTAPAFVDEPVASLTASAAADARLTEVAQALNADESLKGSKITVQLEDSGATLLTGAALTQEQAQRAAEIAAGPDGQAVVVNTILPDRGQMQKAAPPTPQS